MNQRLARGQRQRRAGRANLQFLDDDAEPDYRAPRGAGRRGQGQGEAGVGAAVAGDGRGRPDPDPEGHAGADAAGAQAAQAVKSTFRETERGRE